MNMDEGNTSMTNVSNAKCNLGSKYIAILSKCFIVVLLLILSWAVPWSVIGNDCLPGGSLFGLILLFDVCVLAGFLVRNIPLCGLPSLPGLLGMLLAGVAMGNIPGIDFAADIDASWSSSLRALALSIILVKAGLDLDPASLRKLKGVCIRLTAIPCLVESVVCAVACYVLLGFSWEWGLSLGFVLGAVTPAVIVPSMLKLQNLGYGTLKGIPTLVIAASSFDDVLAISGFSVVIGIAFSKATSEVSSYSEVYSNPSTTTVSTEYANSTDEYSMLAQNDTESSSIKIFLTVIRGPLEMVGGIVISIIIGAFFWYVPHATQKNIVMIRTLNVIGVGILAVFGSRRAGFPGSGALIAIGTSFVASLRWKKFKEPISEKVGLLWIGFEPFMFGLIGSEIRLNKLDAGTVGLGIAVLSICLVFRIMATFLAVSAATFTISEKVFLCIAWLPKATVQAAIGSVALDTAREVQASENVIIIAEKILTISVLSILVTAPLGAAAIGLSGPRLLSQNCAVDPNYVVAEESPQDCHDDELSYAKDTGRLSPDHHKDGCEDKLAEADL